MILYQVGLVEVEDQVEWKVEIWLNKHNYWIVANNNGIRGPILHYSYPTCKQARKAAESRVKMLYKMHGASYKVRWI